MMGQTYSLDRETRNSRGILVRKPVSKRLHGDPRRYRVDTTGLGSCPMAGFGISKILLPLLVD
jgi:hypothetical protein